MSKLSHVDESGKASMVDVSEKPASERIAVAEAIIAISRESFDLVIAGEIKKGDVLATARIAGIMAAKKTSELIPLCHPLMLSHVGVEFTPLPERSAFRILASAKTTGQTGVEMEAMTAASVAALTVYDMVKAVDKSAVIETIRLLTKSGGKSGSYEAPEPATPVSKAAPRSKAQRSGRVVPRELMHETAGPRASSGAANGGAQRGEREALRAFMNARHLRASEWARSASVPVNVLYGYLSGKARDLPPGSTEKLAKAARASLDEMFGRKGSR
jgi:cyclic pyranopterin phosphate synthase